MAFHHTRNKIKIPYVAYLFKYNMVRNYHSDHIPWNSPALLLISSQAHYISVSENMELMSTSESWRSLFPLVKHFPPRYISYFPPSLQSDTQWNAFFSKGLFRSFPHFICIAFITTLDVCNVILPHDNICLIK